MALLKKWAIAESIGHRFLIQNSHRNDQKWIPSGYD